ncbi:MAG: hypothetical protein IK086_02010, partial [Clostridia bacterium]|nr:hypothetical protein [Clostridia bacterium]
DFSIVDTANPTENLFGDESYYATKMTDWRSTYAISNGKTFTQTGYTATLLDYDVSRFTVVSQEIEEPGAPAKMLYYKSDGKDTSGGDHSTELLGNRFTAEASKNYYLSFGIATTADIESVNIGAYGDGNRTSINLSPTLVSRVNHGTYYWVTYSITTPSNLSSVASYNMVYVGPKIPKNCDTYIFNMTVYDPMSAVKTNLFTNKNFNTINYVSLGEWVLIVPNTAYQNKSMLASTGYTEWYNTAQTKILRSVDYDESLFAGLKKMLYFNITSGKDIYNRVSIAANQEYNFRFSLTNNIKPSDISIVTKGDSNRDNINSTKALISRTDYGKYSVYEYSITMPASVPTDLGFIGIHFYAGCEGYLFDVKLSLANDATNAQKMSNGNFGSGLDHWACDWNAWFESWSTGTGKTDWSNSSATLRVETFDTDSIDEVCRETMLYFKETKKNGFEVFLQKISGLESGVGYTVSFDYYFKSGALNQAFYFGIFGGKASPSSDQMYFDNQYRASKATNLSSQFDTAVDNGKNVTYTFTLTQAEIDKSAKYYAGFYLLPDPDMITECYIHGMTLYRTDDIEQTNLLMDSEYSTTITSWISNWGATNSNNFVFTRVNAIEFTAQYVPLVEEYFKYPALETHRGDANADGILDVRDLVDIKKRVMNSSAYFVMADADNNTAIGKGDITTSKKMLLGLADKGWEESTIELPTFNKTGGADSAANSRRNTINNYTDNVSVSGTKYYVSSSSGSDSNNGKSTSAPFKTIAKVNELGLTSGDAVLFKRGDTFRTDTTITMVSGVTYSAYGSGAKPKIYGSIKNYADKSIWSTSDGNVWSTSLNAAYADNIVFNDGESVGVRKTRLADLRQNGDFYYDKSGKKFYLFLNQINPGVRFNSIEIASSEYLFHGWGSSTNKVTGAKIINLDLRYAAVHAIALGFVENVKIQKCVIGWSGGGYQSGDRLGNAIQLWRYAKTCNITNNYIYQAFDAAITFQGRLTNQYTGLTIQNNLIEYCSMNFEFWANDENTGGVDSSAKMSNISFTGNILRFGGMGFGGQQRENIPDQAYILTWNMDYTNNQISNFTISNNTFDVANCNYFYSKNTQNYLTISGNTYYQADGSAFQFANGSGDYVNNTSELAAAVAKVESSPGTVQWVS